MSVNREDVFRLAQSEYAAGRSAQAVRACAKLLSRYPADAEARQLHAASLAALGRYADAVTEYGRVIVAFPEAVPALMYGGLAALAAGDSTRAAHWLQRAAGLQPGWPACHVALGIHHETAGNLPAAVTSLRQALALDPALFEAHARLGAVLDRLGDGHGAADAYGSAARLRPDLPHVHRAQADALSRTGRLDEAILALTVLTQLVPGDGIAHADLGAVQLAAHQYAAASVSLERALARDASLYDAAANLGEALRQQGESERAALAFRRAISIRPDLAEAHLGLGRLAATAGNLDEAVPRLRHAVRLQPQGTDLVLSAVRALEECGMQREALGALQTAVAVPAPAAAIQESLGEAWLRIGDQRQALAGFDAALAAEPGRPAALLGRARALEADGQLDESVTAARQLLSRSPANAEAAVLLLSGALRGVDWATADEALAHLGAGADAIGCLPPFMTLALDLDPGQQSAALAQRAAARGGSPREHRPPRRRSPLRVAYISQDFREHPVAHALAPVIEGHDRSRIQPIGVSLAAPDGSAIGDRLRGAFDECLEAAMMSDAELLAAVRRLDVDIAVDLAGYTAGARSILFERGCAPLQVGYLGFPGSTGPGYNDVLIADPVVVPPQAECHYRERIVRLPHCYLPFDRARNPARSATRASAGLPAEGVVLCGFANGYKISRPVFDAWLAILRAVPSTVLWLRHQTDAASERLRRAAEAAGVGRGRLLFAGHEPDRETYLSRLALADLFLDTYPYNAHTTAVEALWMGVPLITCRGDKFAGRVGASALTAAGLPELICSSFAEYHELGCSLALDERRRQALRGRLADARASSPLFDTDAYVTALEAALHRMASGYGPTVSVTGA